MAETLSSRIGNTPLLRLCNVLPADFPPQVEVYAKAEWFNPCGSVKDRPALKMIQEGLLGGKFKKGQVLIDSSSGNTGIAYAMLGAEMGFSVELAMPRSVAADKRKIIQSFGATIIDTDPLEGSDGARQRVRQIVDKNPGRYFFPDQYGNPANSLAHYETTGPEIWEQTQGRITHFVSGLGTSGTMMGTSRYLKERNPKIYTLAVQPEPFHGIEGLKNMEEALRVPIYDPKMHDRKITVSTESAYEWSRELSRKEGFSAGLSSGAVLGAAIQTFKNLERGVIVIVFPDAGIPDEKPETGVPDVFMDFISRQAEQAYPKECCGMILGPLSNPKLLSRVRPCRNAQDEYHAADPDNFPRTSRTGYFIEPKELFDIQREARRTGQEIRVIYHSHIDAGAYFSAEDKRIALCDAEPAYPGVDYLVVSVLKGKAGDANLFGWESTKKEFFPKKL